MKMALIGFLALISHDAYAVCEQASDLDSEFDLTYNLVAASGDSYNNETLNHRDSMEFTALEEHNGYLYLAFRDADYHTGIYDHSEIREHEPKLDLPTHESTIIVYRKLISDFEDLSKEWEVHHVVGDRNALIYNSDGKLDRDNDVEFYDYRDPYLTKSTDGGLILGTYYANRSTDTEPLQSAVSFYNPSNNTWSELQNTNIGRSWLWKAEYFFGKYYGITKDLKNNRLLTSSNGEVYAQVYDSFSEPSIVLKPSIGFMDEAHVIKLHNEDLVYIGRHKDPKPDEHKEIPAPSYVGISYDDGITWDSSIIPNLNVQGPALEEVSDELIIAAYRDPDAAIRQTVVSWLDITNSRVCALFRLKANEPDYFTGYPSMIINQGNMYVSYYNTTDKEDHLVKRSEIMVAKIPVNDIMNRVENIKIAEGYPVPKLKSTFIPYETPNGGKIMIPIQ